MKRALMAGVQPEVVQFYRALYDPFFTRALWTWQAMRSLGSLSCEHADVAEYCLDRPDPVTDNRIF